MLKKILVLSSVLIGCLFAYCSFITVQEIHVPIEQKSVVLPLGEQNRLENQWPVKATDPYIEIHNMEISSLPKDAWCRSLSDPWWDDMGLTLKCAWPTDSGAAKFQTATFFVKLPREDVASWQLDRENLVAVPKMRTWIGANFFFLFLSALTLYLALFMFYASYKMFRHKRQIEES